MKRSEKGAIRGMNGGLGGVGRPTVPARFRLVWFCRLILEGSLHRIDRHRFIIRSRFSKRRGVELAGDDSRLPAS